MEWGMSSFKWIDPYLVVISVFDSLSVTRNNLVKSISVSDINYRAENI